MHKPKRKEDDEEQPLIQETHVIKVSDQANQNQNQTNQVIPQQQMMGQQNQQMQMAMNLQQQQQQMMGMQQQQMMMNQMGRGMQQPMQQQMGMYPTNNYVNPNQVIVAPNKTTYNKNKKSTSDCTIV